VSSTCQATSDILAFNDEEIVTIERSNKQRKSSSEILRSDWGVKFHSRIEAFATESSASAIRELAPLSCVELVLSAISSSTIATDFERHIM
jgi:hypothetical protein